MKHFEISQSEWNLRAECIFKDASYSMQTCTHLNWTVLPNSYLRVWSLFYVFAVLSPVSFLSSLLSFHSTCISLIVYTDIVHLFSLSLSLSVVLTFFLFSVIRSFTLTFIYIGRTWCTDLVPSILILLFTSHEIILLNLWFIDHEWFNRVTEILHVY